MVKKRYYIELCEEDVDENYCLQSQWFSTKKGAVNWFYSIDFLEERFTAFVMTANFYSEDNYDIVKSEKIGG